MGGNPETDRAKKLLSGNKKNHWKKNGNIVEKNICMSRCD